MINGYRVITVTMKKVEKSARTANEIKIEENFSGRLRMLKASQKKNE